MVATERTGTENFLQNTTEKRNDNSETETSNQNAPMGKYHQHSIGKAKALALAESKWWEGKNALEVALAQMFTAELMMPFSAFHESLEKALGRTVAMHEISINFDGIAAELLGEKEAPTMDEIIGLIPE